MIKMIKAANEAAFKNDRVKKPIYKGDV